MLLCNQGALVLNAGSTSPAFVCRVTMEGFGIQLDDDSLLAFFATVRCAGVQWRAARPWEPRGGSRQTGPPHTPCSDNQSKPFLLCSMTRNARAD